MKLEEFDYKLPPGLIAQHPAAARDISRMMVLNRRNKSIEHKHFYDIIDYLGPDDLLVMNNTRVIPARIFGKKETGGRVEIFLTRCVDDTHWQCLLRPQKRIRTGTKIYLNPETFVETMHKDTEDKWIISTPDNFEKILCDVGTMPLPPYIKREPENPYVKEDGERYQTVYAKEPGAVAAPTAGLHFTSDILQNLQKKGVQSTELTLHVGLGTFKPVKCENIEDHVMHAEYYSISEAAANTLNKARKDGKRIIAIGTTSIRTLETVAQANNGNIISGTGWSKIFIYPGYQFQVIDACLTNFHLPKSTLIMLVSAFAGKDLVFEAYQKAIESNYRFYSYGDCMLIL
jgi:S-adenosylmethionine:tRNA ribosyltransferase-isomerase